MSLARQNALRDIHEEIVAGWRIPEADTLWLLASKDPTPRLASDFLVATAADAIFQAEFE